MSICEICRKEIDTASDLCNFEEGFGFVHSECKKQKSGRYADVIELLTAYVINPKDPIIIPKRARGRYNATNNCYEFSKVISYTFIPNNLEEQIIVSIINLEEVYDKLTESYVNWVKPIYIPTGEKLIDNFEQIVEKQFNLCKTILCKKGIEYARQDRLSNFRKAAHLQNCSNEEALWGMAIKHVVSLSDFIEDLEQNKQHTIEQWEEKITDNINYLLLLKALLVERLGAN